MSDLSLDIIAKISYEYLDRKDWLALRLSSKHWCDGIDKLIEHVSCKFQESKLTIKDKVLQNKLFRCELCVNK